MDQQQFHSFDLSISKIIQYGDRRFFVLEDQQKRGIVPAHCAHRGGPLHLAESAGETKLRCPWHGHLVCKGRLLEQSLPAIRCGSLWRVCLPKQEA